MQISERLGWAPPETPDVVVMGIETVLLVFGVIFVVAIGVGVAKARRNLKHRVEPPPESRPR